MKHIKNVSIIKCKKILKLWKNLKSHQGNVAAYLVLVVLKNYSHNLHLLNSCQEHLLSNKNAGNNLSEYI